MSLRLSSLDPNEPRAAKGLRSIRLPAFGNSLTDECRQIAGRVIEEGSDAIEAFRAAANVLSKNSNARDTDFEFNGVRESQAEGD